VPPDRGGAQTDEPHADPVRDLAHLAQVLVHLVTGLVDRLERGARQLQLPAGFEADIRAVLFQPDDVVALEDRATSRTVLQSFQHGTNRPFALVGQRRRVSRQ
jgi:hypothetical protein